MIDLTKLKKEVEKGQKKSGSASTEEGKKWKVPVLKEKDSLTFSLVTDHKHQVEEGSPFVPLVSYRLKTYKDFKNETVYPESSFDETKIDPVAAHLDTLKQSAREQNSGDDNLPLELWKTHQPNIYHWVPVVSTEFESTHPVKWLRLTATVFEDLVNLISEWYDEETGIIPDIKLTRSTVNSYSVSPTKAKGDDRCIKKVDQGLLQDALDNLPALDDGVIFVHKDPEKLQKMLRDNFDICMKDVEDEGEISYGSDIDIENDNSGKKNLVDSNDKKSLDDFFKK